jgi:hypothetical protein
MTKTPDIGMALTHNVLHHKRPALLPMLDGRTVEVLRNQSGGRNPWQ